MWAALPRRPHGRHRLLQTRRQLMMAEAIRCYRDCRPDGEIAVGRGASVKLQVEEHDLLFQIERVSPGVPAEPSVHADSLRPVCSREPSRPSNSEWKTTYTAHWRRRSSREIMAWQFDSQTRESRQKVLCIPSPPSVLSSQSRVSSTEGA